MFDFISWESLTYIRHTGSAILRVPYKDQVFVVKYFVHFSYMYVKFLPHIPHILLDLTTRVMFAKVFFREVITHYSHWVLFYCTLIVVLSWPEYGRSRPKHVAKYNLIVIITSCLLYAVYWRFIIYYTMKRSIINSLHPPFTLSLVVLCLLLGILFLATLNLRSALIWDTWSHIRQDDGKTWNIYWETTEMQRESV